MKLEDMIILPKSKDLVVFDSLINMDKFQLNGYGVGILSEVLLKNKEDKLNEEQSFIYNQFSNYLTDKDEDGFRVQRSTMKSINVELLEKCNLKCTHCYLGDKKSKHRIHQGVFETLIDEARELGAYALGLTGGEVLLDKQLLNKVSYARENGFKTMINSNGMLLDDNITSELKRLQLALFTVTLNGNKSQHEEVYGNNSYDKAIQGLELLKAYQVPIGINFMRTDNNSSYEQSFKNEMIDRFGIVKFTGADIQNKGSAVTNNLKGIPIIDKSKPTLPECGQDYSKGLSCMAGKDAMFVRSDGSVTPCSELEESIGNINTESLVDIYRGFNDGTRR